MVTKERLTCCTPAGAWAWVELLAVEACEGDRVSRRMLPAAIWHALVIEAQS